MRTLVLVAAIVMSVRPCGQSPPVFKAEAYVVTNRVAMLGRDGKPVAGLTVDDFSITLDKKIPVAMGVAENPEKRGYYLLSFNPPDPLRDGKTHRIDVKVKASDGKWKTLPLRWTAKFAKPRFDEKAHR